MYPPKPTYEELAQRVKELEKKSLEHKYVEKTLKSERDKLKTLIDGLTSADIGVDIVSTDYEIIQQNQTLIDRFGDIAGKKCHKAYMALEEPCVYCPMVKALKNKRLEKAESRGANGRDYEIISAPLTNPEGTVDKAVEVILDITDRKKIEKALQKNKAILNAVVDSLPFDVFALDPNNRYFLQNSICKKNWGDFIGKCPEDLSLNNETLNLWLNNNRRAFSGETVADEVEYHSLEGKKYLYHNIIAPIRDEEKIIGVLGVLVDISNRKQTEEALRESKSKLSAMLASIGDHMSMMDKDLNIIWANEMAEKIFGNDIIGRKCYEVFQKRTEPCEPYPCITLKAFQDGKIHEHDTQMIDKDGKTIFFHCTANVALRDKEGKPISVLEISRDITENVRAENALQKAKDELEQRVEERTVELLKTNERLKESEERFRKLAEGSFEAIVLHEKGVILDANNQYYEMFGYNAVELAGKDAISLTATPESVKNIKKHISLGNFGPYEVTGVKKDGTKFPMEVRIKLTRHNGHKVRMAVIRDLTEQKQAEKTLRESEARFRDTAAMLPSVIIEYGLDGILTYVNPHGYEMAGYNPEDFEKGFHVLRLVALEEHDKHYERIQGMMQGEKLPPTEYRLLRKDGSTFWGLVTSSLIYKDGEVAGVRTYTIDISERKEAEETLKERTRELEIKTKSLEEMNTAMEVLLKKREEDKTNMEDNVLTNVKGLVEPYIRKIKKTKLNDQQKTFLNITEANLNEIVSPFVRKMSKKYLDLTPQEIRIANLIKHGNSSKKIAEILNLSPRTIETHRKNIRRKTGLEGKKANLRSHLLSLD